MKTENQLLITVHDSPYRILDVPFDADPKVVIGAVRALFRENPRKAGRIGPIAQKKLTDPKERMKADAFCCQVDLPHVNLSGLKEQLGSGSQNLYCRALENPLIFSDLHFSDHLNKNLKADVEFGEIPYRSGYDQIT